MEMSSGVILARQFGAAIDTLDQALAACPASLWTERVWPADPPPYFPPRFAEFWHLSYHAIVWLDLYLTGVPEEQFAPPPPFPTGESDSHETEPEQPYTKEELRTYLAAMRQKCHDTLQVLTDEQARRSVSYSWSRGKSVSYFELQLYNMRHVQEHAAQLSLFLGQHGVAGDDIDWVSGMKDDSAST